jgi:hypothetical protein
LPSLVPIGWLLAMGVYGTAIIIAQLELWPYLKIISGTEKPAIKAGLARIGSFRGLSAGFPNNRAGYVRDLLPIAWFGPFPDRPDAVALGWIDGQELAGVALIGICKGF